MGLAKNVEQEKEMNEYYRKPGGASVIYTCGKYVFFSFSRFDVIEQYRVSFRFDSKSLNFIHNMPNQWHIM